eukprot:1021749-Pleurochrysis_carterae.AAC.3
MHGGSLHLGTLGSVGRRVRARDRVNEGIIIDFLQKLAASSICAVYGYTQSMLADGLNAFVYKFQLSRNDADIFRCWSSFSWVLKEVSRVLHLSPTHACVSHFLDYAARMGSIQASNKCQTASTASRFSEGMAPKQGRPLSMTIRAKTRKLLVKKPRASPLNQ